MSIFLNKLRGGGAIGGSQPQGGHGKHCWGGGGNCCGGKGGAKFILNHD